MNRKLTAALLVMILIFTACTYSPLTNTEISQSENTAQFHFIDVGQGDCTLIQSGDTAILIDAGTYESGHIIYNYMKDLGINDLDCFIGTHPHDDHLGGAWAVLSTFDVKDVYLNGDTSSAYFFEDFVDTLIEENITPYIPEMNEVYNIGPFEVEFLSPTKDFEDTNNNSLVTVIRYKDISALFTGDAEKSVEMHLIENGADLNADILQVGHHGSRNASCDEFLRKVSPAVSVIQCGANNSYGHPHDEVLERFENISSELLRTDQLGNIILRTDGESIYDASGEVFEKSDSDALPVEEDQTYIGNKNSKIFHTQTCPNLPGENNRVQLTTREEAINNGYNACGNCNP